LSDREAQVIAQASGSVIASTMRSNTFKKCVLRTLINHLPHMKPQLAADCLGQLSSFRTARANTSMWGFGSHHPWFDTIPKEDN